MIRDLLQDLRYGARSLRRSPGFTATVVLTLALGIGANAAIFSLLNAVVLKALPVPEPERLVLFSRGQGGTGSGPLGAGPIQSYSYPLYRWLREDGQAFQGLAAQQPGLTRATVQWSGGEASADLAEGRCVSANYFGVLGVSVLHGRGFLPEEEGVAGANRVLVLSHQYWQRRFGGNPAVMGARLVVSGSEYTVVGVAPPGFNGSEVGRATDFWAPLGAQAALARTEAPLDQRDRWWLLLVGRLKPDVTLTAAAASVNLTLQQYLAENPVHGKQVSRQAVRIELLPGGQGVSQLRGGFRQPLLILMAAVGLLLLIVCLNVSHLMLARSMYRQREMVVRTALGASRARLVRQWMVEGLLLAAAACAAGAVLAYWLIDGLLALVGGGRGLALDVSPDLRLVGFTALLALVTALVLGLVPARQASRADLQTVLRAGSPGSVRGGSHGLGSRILMASQVTLSLVLLVGAGLLAGTISRLRSVDKGFEDEHLLVVQIAPGLTGLRGTSLLSLYEELLARVTALPDVRMASLSREGVLSGSRSSKSIVPAATSSMLDVQTEIVTTQHFQTLGIALASGRSFTRDDAAGAPPVAVVNEALARRIFGSTAGALGQRFRFWDGPERLEIVGVVKDARINDLRRQPPPLVYLPVAQKPEALRTLEVRASGDPALLAEAIRRAVGDAHPGLPVQRVLTMQAQMGRSLQRERILAVLASAVGLLALLLVGVGLYGVISQWGAQRTREIGVRMALGATGIGVRWMVLRQAFALVLTGVAVGLPAAVAVAHAIKAMLYGVSPMEPAALLLAALAMLVVATAAAYLPARRASRVDPMVALRAE
jgi:predicted permease